METRWFGYQGYTGLLMEQEAINTGGSFGAQGPQGGTATGCQGPFVNGVYGTSSQGGFGAQGCCPCKCCPPPCCSSVVASFSCGNQDADFCSCFDAITTEGGEVLCPEGSQGGSQGDFFCIEGSQSPSPFSVTVDVTITPAASQGICCIEYLGGSFRAVGSGYVEASAGSVGSQGTCGSFTVKINGSQSPVFVSDGGSISVSLESSDTTCCPCSQSGTSNPCGLTMRMAAMVRNDKIILDRRAVVQKVAAMRRQKVRQKMRTLRSSPS